MEHLVIGSVQQIFRDLFRRGLDRIVALHIEAEHIKAPLHMRPASALSHKRAAALAALLEFG